ncbi:glycogen synthase, partial [Kipferlia bialata]|eukprot:g13798.t1
MVLGAMVAEFVKACCGLVLQPTAHTVPRLVIHSHEWLGGVNQLILKGQGGTFSGVRPAHVFTTHATILGRYLAAGGEDLNSIQYQHRDWDHEADKRGICFEY